MLTSYIKGILFVLTWLFPLIPWVSYEYFGISWAMPFLLFGVAGVANLITGRDKTVPLSIDMLHSFSGTYFKLIPRLYFVFFVIGGAKVLMLLKSCTTIDAIFLIMSWGMVTSLAVVSLHEVSDSFSAVDKAIETVLCALTGYGHFSKENMAHHYEEGSHGMGFVARRGENVFSFVCKRIPLGFEQALIIEEKILASQGKGQAYNSIFQNYALVMVFATVINEFFGLLGLICYVAQILIAMLSSSVVAYIQHYGLEWPEHSEADEGIAWEGNHFWDNVTMLNITRHAHHHMRKHLPYYLLKPMPESPKLPFSYPVMTLIAIIPPLWFSIMNKRLDDYRKSVASNGLGCAMIG